MKKLLFFVISLVLAGNIAAENLQTSISKNQTLEISNEKNDRDLVEGFEWDEMSNSWTVYNVDGDFKQWELTTGTTHSGAKCMSVGYDDGGPNNDWLITPKLSIQDNAELKFWARSKRGDYLDSYNVLISETGIEIADFTITLDNVVDAPHTYTEKTYDLSAYSGKDIYIAIQNVSVDKWRFYLDDFSVSNCEWQAADDVLPPEFISLKGNKALIGDDIHLKLNVKDESAMPETITASYNLAGNDETLTMSLVSEKESYQYIGTIESPVAAETCDITFHLEDAVFPANTVDVVKQISFIEPLVVESIDDGFEDSADFSVDPEPYFFIDKDEEETYSFLMYSFANEGYTGSFITFNPEAASISYARYAPHSGQKYMACIAANGETKINNDWMISPKITMGDDYVVEFWAKSVSADQNLERFKVGVSTTGGTVEDFTIISKSENASGEDYIEVPTEWTQYVFDLSEYAAEEYVFVGINCVSEDGLMFMVDDFKVGPPAADSEAPVLKSLSGNAAQPGEEMNLILTLSDRTGVAEPVVASYTINGIEGTIEMTAGKSDFQFVGTIPGQAEGVGTISFAVSDTSPAGNSTVLEGYEIEWRLVEPGWYGAVDIQNTNGLGLQNSAPWKLGMELDFGSAQFVIKKIAYMCSEDTYGPVNWGVLDIDDNDGSWTEDVLIDNELLTDVPAVLDTWSEVEINSSTVLTGKIGLTVDLTAGGIWGRDDTSILGISYFFYQNSWVKLGESAFSTYPGDWCLKCFVDTEGGIEEMIPGNTELYQNYPNPFNPSTTINFFNNMSGDVKLSVFNVKGELVSTLVNGHMSASQHSVNFDASNLNSGVYYYTLKTPTKSITKKMIMVK